MYQNRQFLILSVSELHLVDFSQVLETSQETVRKSVDDTKTFIKWDGDVEPSFMSNLTSKEGPYSYDEIKNILLSNEWLKPVPDGMKIP